ncbi:MULTISPECIES: MFS transporter [unclassified Sphingobium]|uniref:MFS transporter n=1 Tax=unclassified Sphingobium TaxID=2611147 RepID=UPI002225439E|nr:MULTISPECIES: MFS transporter [unclassified Sphingobium]MCW2395748.1 ACS family glucarate transporter-like MFS transporter [Sphingobium sp. B8D3B]MCW2419263.1 ACS family glucarate transporter-like MFS transporter [Sphingobium sp. B8D3C]
MSIGLPAGKVRWSIVAILFFVTMINYADRAVLSLAAPLLSKDLQIDPLELGIVFSAFGWAYVVAQLPGGWLLDRFGAKRVYLAAILLWSGFTALQSTVALLTGTAAIIALFTLRFLVGFCEGPSFPGNARIVASWFPASERGTASAIFNSAQYFATVLFAPIMGWIIGVFGWPEVFLFMGAVGLAAAFIWVRKMHEPRNHPRLKEAELELIIAGGAIVDAPTKAADGPPPQPVSETIKMLLANRTLLGLYLGQFSINTLTYFFITWFPVYLVQERGLSIVKAGLFATMPAICGFVGGLLGGIWSDWLLKRGHSLTLARKTPIITGMLVSLAILGCNYSDSELLLLVFMSLAFFGKGVGALGWAVLSDVAPRNAAGLSGGIFNMFGNLSSILTPIAIGLIVKETGSFDLVLVYVASSAALAAFSFLFLVGKIQRVGSPG